MNPTSNTHQNKTESQCYTNNKDTIFKRERSRFINKWDIWPLTNQYYKRGKQETRLLPLNGIQSPWSGLKVVFHIQKTRALFITLMLLDVIIVYAGYNNQFKKIWIALLPPQFFSNLSYGGLWWMWGKIRIDIHHINNICFYYPTSILVPWHPSNTGCASALCRVNSPCISSHYTGKFKFHSMDLDPSLGMMWPPCPIKNGCYTGRFA